VVNETNVMTPFRLSDADVVVYSVSLYFVLMFHVAIRIVRKL